MTYVQDASDDLNLVLLRYMNPFTPFDEHLWTQSTGLIDIPNAAGNFEGYRAMDVSANGQYAVGVVNAGPEQYLFAWSAAGTVWYEPLISQVAAAPITARVASTGVAAVLVNGQILWWDFVAGTQNWLAVPPVSYLHDISDDGTAAAGVFNAHYCRISPTTGIHAFFDIATGPTMISSDGEIICGSGPFITGPAAVWQNNVGVTTIPVLPAYPDAKYVAYDMTGAGDAVVGKVMIGNTVAADFYWSASTGTWEIPLPPDAQGPWYDFPAISKDGSRVMAMAVDGQGMPYPYSWSIGTGIQPVSLGEGEAGGGFQLRADGSAVLIEGIGGDVFQLEFGAGGIGSRMGAPALANSTGLPAQLDLTGSAIQSDNDLRLTARQIAPGSFGCFLVASQAQDPVLVPGGSGLLQLGANLRRFNLPSEIGMADAFGEFSLPLDLSGNTGVPGSLPTAVGQTHYFQAVYRDPATGGTFNFTDLVTVTLH
ncbi:MAG: hypothetical protein R3E96_09145 [Planctomycetota bacterium]